jgi:hypothetical protein
MLLNIRRDHGPTAIQAPDGARLCHWPDGQDRLALPTGPGGVELMLTASRVLEYARQGVYGLSIRDQAPTG